MRRTRLHPRRCGRHHPDSGDTADRTGARWRKYRTCIHPADWREITTPAFSALARGWDRGGILLKFWTVRRGARDEPIFDVPSAPRRPGSWPAASRQASDRLPHALSTSPIASRHPAAPGYDLRCASSGTLHQPPKPTMSGYVPGCPPPDILQRPEPHQKRPHCSSLSANYRSLHQGMRIEHPLNFFG
jgi:hypothetical protein